MLKSVESSISENVAELRLYYLFRLSARDNDITIFRKAHEVFSGRGERVKFFGSSFTFLKNFQVFSQRRL